MAEAFSLAVNILTVIDITVKVINRINEFRDSVDGIPRVLQALSVELPVLNLVLGNISSAMDDDRIPEDSQKALQPLITDFREHIQAILGLIDKMRPKDPSRMTRGFKAVTSFRYDSEIMYHEKVIRGYSSTLSLERVVSGPSKDLSALQPPLVPSFICPYGQNPDFVERTILTDLIAQRGPGSRHALFGGGGMGKSQLAISYGYSIQDAAPDTWIFWIDAESAVKFERGYREIADVVRLKHRNDRDTDILSLLCEWLRDKSNGTWVMILDNADNKDVFTSQPSSSREKGKQLRDFLPQTSNGSILVTSRSRDVAYQVTGNYKHILAVEEMTESEALALLRSQLDEAHPESDLQQLADTLGFIPLALTQAAANISRRSLPIPEYLEELKKGAKTSKSLLDESLDPPKRDSRRSNSIAATWRTTFEYVCRTTPSAARLLSLMCLFYSQEIPMALLKDQYGEEVMMESSKRHKPWWRRRPRTKRKKEQIRPVQQSPPQFEEDWLILRDFSLIKLNRSREHSSMHPLVQLITQNWLVSHEGFDAWSVRFFSLLDANLPDPGRVEYANYAPLIAHAYIAVSYDTKHPAVRSLQDWASITRKVANHTLQYQQNFDAARKLYAVASEAYENSLGPNAVPTLECHMKRGELFLLTEHYEKAEIMYLRVLVIRTKIWGLEEEDTLYVMDRLGDALESQHRNNEAEKLHVQALNIRLRKFGPTHSITQAALKKYAWFLSSHGRYEEAYKTSRQAYEARAQGKETVYDSQWADQLDLSGLMFLTSGQYAKSEPYFREAIHEREKALPDGEFELMQSIDNLARTLAEQGNVVEAERFFRRAFQWYDNEARPDPERLLRTMSALALMLCKLDQLEEAEVLARRCLAASCDDKVGTKEDLTFESKWLLASVFEKQGLDHEALELYKEAFEGTKLVLGERDVNTQDYQRDYEKLRNIVSARDQSDGHHEDTIAGAEADDPALPPFKGELCGQRKSNIDELPQSSRD